MLKPKKGITIFFYNNVVQLLKQEIERRLHTELSIQDLAEFSCVSYHHLRDIFFQIEGVPLKQYINNVRVERAAQLIASDTLCLNDIAYKVGYSNKCSLSKAFKRKYGITPGEYKLQKERQNASIIERTAA
jgi:AraC-like DNA-binding protein